MNMMFKYKVTIQLFCQIQKPPTDTNETKGQRIKTHFILTQS